MMSKGEPPRGFPDLEVPPWKLPGNFRLDCEPHHSDLLCFLANIAWVCTLLSLTLFAISPCLFCMGDRGMGVYSSLLLAVLGAVVGLATWLGAHRELTGMRAGLVDPSGQWQAVFARDRGRASLLLCLFFLLGCGLLVCWV